MGHQTAWKLEDLFSYADDLPVTSPGNLTTVAASGDKGPCSPNISTSADRVSYNSGTGSSSAHSSDLLCSSPLPDNSTSVACLAVTETPAHEGSPASSSND